jgi:hypothetical protein
VAEPHSSWRPLMHPHRVMHWARRRLSSASEKQKVERAHI